MGALLKTLKIKHLSGSYSEKRQQAAASSDKLSKKEDFPINRA